MCLINLYNEVVPVVCAARIGTDSQTSTIFERHIVRNSKVNRNGVSLAENLGH
jgi:hypothetical protein